MLKVELENARQNLSFEHDGGPLEFGRAVGNGDRCIVEDLSVSRDQLRILELPGNRVRIENLSQRVTVLLSHGGGVNPGTRFDAPLPVDMIIGATQLRLGAGAASSAFSSSSNGDSLATVAPPVSARQTVDFETIRNQLASEDGVDSETLIRWFETVVGVLQAAATSAEFYERTARAVVDLVGLDDGLVLVREPGDQWTIAAHHGSQSIQGEPYSRQVLDFVVDEGRTFFRELGDLNPTASLENVSAAVASPILGTDRSVVGVVYGRRGLESLANGRPIRSLEAHLVQVLASAVGAGLQRVEKEAEASRWRVQLESFFTPRLVEELDRNPNMLDANERVVTVLFADIRGFTDCTARLEAADALQLVGNVMDHLSAVVHEHDGAIVDYYGDGLMAMWNAPVDQPDHANRATNTALDMLAGLSEIGGGWEAALGTPLRIGIGINTGEAVVGNVGSQRKFKYGALGLTVNLAQRIETATKRLGFPALCAGSTRETVHTRAKHVRVGRCLLSGALEPTELHVVLPKRDRTLTTKTLNAHAAALEAFEAGEWSQAITLVNADPALAALPLGAVLLERATILDRDDADPSAAVLDLRTK